MAGKMPGWFEKCMADGGTVKRVEAQALDTAASIAKPVGGLATIAGALAPKGTGKLLRALTIGTGVGTYGVGRAAEEMAKSKREDADRAIDGMEDRKCGGRIGRKSGGWIKKAVGNNKGALHRALHVPEGEKIPAKKLAKAEHSKNPTMRRRANLAKTLKGLNK